MCDHRHVYKSFIVCMIIIYPCFSKKLTNDVKSAESINGYYLKDVAQKLSDEFNKTNNDELVIPYIWNIYGQFKYKPVLQDVESIVTKMTTNLETKLNDSFVVLNRTAETIEQYYTSQNFSLHSAVSPCKTPKITLTDYEIFNIKENLGNSYSEQFYSIKRILIKQEHNLRTLKGSLKQAYFLSASDVTTDTLLPISKCDTHDHSFLWKNYMARLQTRPRYVMLLLDHGGSLSKWQFHIVKSVAKQMISVLTADDRVGLMAISDDWSAPYATDECVSPNQVPVNANWLNIAPASPYNKELLVKFVDSMVKGSGGTNHSLGFEQALHAVKESEIPANETVMLLYVSRGLLSSLTEAKTVLETISSMLKQVHNNVVINTCAVINESKPVMYEMHFLRDISKQNYTKYKIDSADNYQRGLTLSVYLAQSVGLAVMRFYNVLNDVVSVRTGPHVTLPTYDHTSEDLFISLTLPVGANGTVGLLGVDLYFSNLMEQITYYSNYEDFSYAFVVTLTGVAVVHPSYPRPIANKQQPNFVDIKFLENVGNFTTLRGKLLNDPKGDYTLSDLNITKTYHWRRVSQWFVVCVVVNENTRMPVRPYKISTASSQLVHHRLDIVPAANLCRHLNQIATLDAGSLYLSASCFQSPTSHATVSKESLSSYMAYLKDVTRLLANPGLKDEVRDDVAALSHILEYLRNQHLNGFRTKYIVRRYVTSYSGVLMMFPGGVVSGGFEPTRRSWFLKAIEHKGYTVLTAPYLDAGGAGYIVTLAYATEHVVVAMDVTYGYVFKMLLEQMPFCADKSVKCFMIDDRGYLIYHPNLIDPNGHGPIEQQHIIRKESLVTNDILNRKDFVKKMVCNDYSDGTIQRYYTLNTTLTDVLVNALHGIKYQITAVPGTNVFVGLVNATCELVATFCPCSMIDRLCLNCNRMEPKECECPCECPLNKCHKNSTENPVCPVIPEQTLIAPMDSNKFPELKPCIPVVCETHLTFNSCLGVTGCEWCQMDVDGVNPLVTPFCTSMTSCFNGVLGSVTPYGDSISETATSEDVLASQYSPFVPVIGSVVGMCLILTLLFFCYRSYTSQTVERFYLNSNHENEVPMSDLNVSDDYHELDNHQDKLLQETKTPEPVSPYCVSTGYRRPPTAVDSDHGYSTMTPHDESEHLSFAPLEIDSLEDESDNTSVSSKQPPLLTKKVVNTQLMQITALPTRNCIVAPVTVHRNMETTQ